MYSKDLALDGNGFFARKIEDLIRLAELEKAFFTRDLITSFAIALMAKGEYLYSHSLKTAQYALLIADIVEADVNRERLSLAALLHDIGKLFVSDAILLKDSALTEREMEIMRMHPLWSSMILAEVSAFQDIVLPVRSHHERPDGSGYPDGLRLDEIPLPSKIINIADRFSAMTVERPYRSAYPDSIAVGVLMEDINAFFGKKAGLVVKKLLGREYRL